ncbi:histidine phosphatase family protein [Halobacillus litoralis]|uniref:histidine phosphatase family protein n=1 Tax=Halobacillus litoralis TaxID=45668 RepID=UPI001CD640F7|nr:histidine phosphatase family protein [Halobacillus litoralis]MCA0969297.1 histidine phosphatase family protein [Halobacillus litoralis]
MIYVVRHGETDWNKERRMQGREGKPLNESGIKQAEEVRAELASTVFQAVYSSPQQRAVETAEIVTGHRVTIDERLDVFDLGRADELPIQDVQYRGALPDPAIYEGMEDPDIFVKRVFAFMNWLEGVYGESDEDILLSGHRCTTGAIGAYFEGIPADRNIQKYSSDHGRYKVYDFKKNRLPAD